jgi:hypothetical protein
MTDQALSNAELIGKVLLSNSTSGVSSTNQKNLIFSEFCQSSATASGQFFRHFSSPVIVATQKPSASFPYHVVNIVGASAEKQMGRIHASGIVAFVKNASRNGAMGKNI